MCSRSLVVASVLTVNPCQMHLIDLFRRRGHNVVAILADNCHNGEFLCFRISYGSSPEIMRVFLLSSFSSIVEEYPFNSPFCELLAADTAIAINRGCTPTWPTCA